MDEKNKEPSDKVKMISSIVGVVVFIVCLAIFIPIFSNLGSYELEDSHPTNPVTIIHSINQSGDYDGLNIKINSYRFDSEFCGITTSSSTNNTLCIINLTIKNTSSSTINLEESQLFGTSPRYTWSLIYNDSYNYNQKYIARYNDFLASHDSIAPLESITASLCYEVPYEVKTSTKKLQIKFSLNKVSAPVYHVWNLR